MERKIDDRTHKLKRKDVEFAPDLHNNLISMRKAQRVGIEIKFIPGDDELMKAVHNGTTIMHGESSSLGICELVSIKPTNSKKQ